MFVVEPCLSVTVAMSRQTAKSFAAHMAFARAAVNEIESYG